MDWPDKEVDPDIPPGVILIIPKLNMIAVTSEQTGETRFAFSDTAEEITSRCVIVTGIGEDDGKV